MKLAGWFLAAALAVDVPYLSGPLVDEAGLLDEAGRGKIEQALIRLNASDRLQMAVLIAKSLQGEEIEPFALAVAEKWKLGKKGKDDGVLLVIAPNERRMRFEVGYGLEGDLTDVGTKRILEDQLKPWFRQKNYEFGILSAVAAVGDALQVPTGADVPPLPPRQKRGGGLPLNFLIFLLFFLFMFLRPLFSMGRRRGLGGHYWGGGGGSGWSGGGSYRGGGGGFSGGGGGFGGGGSSSSW